MRIIYPIDFPKQLFSVVLSNHGYKNDLADYPDVRSMLLTTGTGNSIIDNANTWNDNHQLLIYKQKITPDGFSHTDRNFIYIALGV